MRSTSPFGIHKLNCGGANGKTSSPHGVSVRRSLTTPRSAVILFAYYGGSARANSIDAVVHLMEALATKSGGESTVNSNSSASDAGGNSRVSAS